MAEILGVTVSELLNGERDTIAFGWIVIIPLLKYGRKGIAASLAVLSAAVIPFHAVKHR